MLLRAMIRLHALLIVVGILASPSFSQSCGVEPPKPATAPGCRDMSPSCVCSGVGECHWVWVCVREGSGDDGSAAAGSAAAGHAVGTAALPSFEVVSIKPYPPKYWPTSSYMEFTAVGFNWRNTIAQELLVYAYDLRDPRLSNRQRLIPGGEKWMFWDWFDIQARMSDENIAALRRLSPSEQEVYKRQLVQSILVNRFKLKLHHATREGPALELVVAKHGPRNMKRVPDNAEGKPNFSDLNHARFEAAPIGTLVALVVALENVPVLNKTGLTGKYDFQLEFSRDSDEPLPPGKSLPPTNDSEPTIFDALKGQLGLKLVRIKLPMDEIVIDHIEKPSEN